MGTLTITDSGTDGTITGVRGIDNYGDLRINQGKVTVTSNNPTGYAVQIRSDNALLIMNGGVLESVNGAIGFEMSKTYKNVNIHLIGGTIDDIKLQGGTTNTSNTITIGSKDAGPDNISVGAISVMPLSQWHINLYSGTVESISSVESNLYRRQYSNRKKYKTALVDINSKQFLVGLSLLKAMMWQLR